MRRPLVFLVLLLALGGIGAFAVARNVFHVGVPAGAGTALATGTGAATPAAGATGTGTGTAVATGTATATTTPDAPGTGTGAAAGTANPPESAPALKPLMTRPLRVATLGWEVIAPGLIANGGMSPAADALLAKAGLDVRLAVTEDPAVIEGALARGGADAEGADVAILPLQTFVASYERVRALAPEVFFVVGWSRGREALAAADPDALAEPEPPPDAPASGAPAPPAPKPAVKVIGAPGEPATFLALFVLDVTGIDPARVRIVSRAKAASAPDAFAAIDRAAPDAAPARAKRLLVTTNDATALVPYVAVAPHGFITANAPALTALARGWLAGAEKLRADVPGAARLVAAQPGAPEAVALLERLGWLEPATVEDGARLAGLSGRSAVTLAELLRQSWRIWRAAGVLSTPAPVVPPADSTVIAALVRASPPPTAPPPPIWTGTPGATVLLDRRLPSGALDEAMLVQQIGWLAGIFERSAVRVTVAHDKKRSAAVVAAAVERFDLPPDRVSAGGRAVPAKVPAVIEVFAAP